MCQDEVGWQKSAAMGTTTGMTILGADVRGRLKILLKFGL